MAQQTISTLKSWFVRGAKPSESQFSDFIDSFRHKSTNILISEVTGLQESLNAASVPIETNFGDVDEDITIPFDRRRLIRINLTDPEPVFSINSTNAVLLQEVLMVFQAGNPEPIFGTGFKRVSSAGWSTDTVNYVRLVYLSATEVTYEVLSFKGSAISNDFALSDTESSIELSWEIVHESNVAHYELERYDLLDDDLLVLDDNIESIGLNYYSFSDELPFGYYSFEYRLRAVYLDGTEEVIDICSFESTGNSEVTGFFAEYNTEIGSVDVYWESVIENSQVAYLVQAKESGDIDWSTVDTLDVISPGASYYSQLFPAPGSYTFRLIADFSDSISRQQVAEYLTPVINP